ncbi:MULTISPECIES: LacI family DNA-binding transcriptional regulator [unclassified Roseitalea]|uniref:LacI family DNA-binding transcriptional regulator n=1 Tax=unclassified Roseitalea TaxID=2639107 RepID=UPI00273E5A1A|nr:MULTISPECIES: LacI family DNA-binding transcriptional regulator [unclassified Roseitalea]
MSGISDQRRATIHDVARCAGVSAATVSKVLRGVSSVRAENARRVRDAVDRLGYRMDPLASGLRNEQRRIIGAVVPDLKSPFFGALVTGLESAAEAAGYTMIVASSRESETREADLVARMSDWRVAGTILAPVRSESGLGAQRMRALDMHAVLVDRASANDRFDTVAADNYAASCGVADLLVGDGHRHVLLHGATRISKAVRTRLEGFTARATALDPRVRIDTLLSDDAVDVQRLAISAYFDTPKADARATAVFSLSQHSTLLVLAELRRRAIRVPDEVALVGFDDAEWMQTTWPSITAVAQPVDAIAERAVHVLLARIEGTTGGYPVQHLEPCVLHARQSGGSADEPSRHVGGG